MNNEERILEMLGQIVQRLDRIENKMDENFRSTRSEIVDAVESVGRKVDIIEGNLKAVEDVTAQNAYDVQLMKRRA